MAKLNLEGKTCNQAVEFSQTVQEPLERLHTMRENVHVVFHAGFVRFLDGKLDCISQVNWEVQLPVSSVTTNQHSITHNHKDWELKGFIMAFRFPPNEMDKVPRKSVYALGLSGDQSS